VKGHVFGLGMTAPIAKANRPGVDGGSNVEEAPDASTPSATGLGPADMAGLRERFPVEQVRRGTMLVRQGDPANRFYIVLSGRFVVLRQGTHEKIAEIGPGEPLGELSFFAETERTGDVVAARDSEVLVVSAEDYGRLTREAPAVIAAMFSAVTRRFARVVGASPAIRPMPPRTLALLPIGIEPTLPDGFASALADAMAPSLACTVLATGAFGLSDDADANDVHAKLDEGTEAGAFLFALERKDTPFVRACLSMADHLLLVAPATDAHTRATNPTEAEREASARFLFDDRSLVVWRENKIVGIADTGKWLDPRDVKLHHHVALDNADDFARLGRFLSGSAVGLVLGGGGAVGCAHLGVFKALQEAGEPVDFVGGTSVGAAMGASMAAGYTVDEAIDLTEEMFVKNRAMRRWTLPVHGLLDHRVYDKWLRRIFDETAIEDMPLNFFAVSSSLTSNSGHVHRRGTAWQAIRASTALPGVFAPFITPTGEVLVDGAMIANVPLEAMRDLKIGPNVVVKLTRPGPWTVSSPYAAYPTRGALLRRLLTRRKSPYYPPLSSIIMRGMIVASEQRLNMAPAEDEFVLLLPQEITKIGFIDWKKGRSVAEATYQHMSRLLEEAGSLDALIKSGADGAA